MNFCSVARIIKSAYIDYRSLVLGVIREVEFFLGAC